MSDQNGPDPSASPGRPGAGLAGRAEILAAAAESFTEFGYHAATIDDVADRVGATKGRVYHYYRSKADLFLDVHLAAMEMMFDAVGPIAAGDLAPVEKLRAMAVTHAAMIIDNFAFQKVSIQGLERPLISDRSSRHRRMLGEVVAQRDRYEQLFADALAEGVAAGAFVDRPPRLLTKPILGALNWLTIWFDPERETDPDARARLAATLADCAIDGVRPR